MKKYKKDNQIIEIGIRKKEWEREEKVRKQKTQSDDFQHLSD